MPLVRCPDCGRDISSEAPACIGCGRPIKREPPPYAFAPPIAAPALTVAVALPAIPPALPRQPSSAPDHGSSPKRNSVFWPDMRDMNSGYRAARRGRVAALVIAASITIFSIAGTLGAQIPGDFGPWNVIDVALWLFVASGIRRRRRIWAVISLLMCVLAFLRVLIGASLVVAIYGWGIWTVVLVVGIVFTYIFINAARTIFLVPAPPPPPLIAGGSTKTIIGIRENSSFRTNLILSNGFESPTDVSVALYLDDGTLASTKSYYLEPLSIHQVTQVVRDMGNGTDVSWARLVVTPSPGAVAAYATVIDNRTNDDRTLWPQ